MSRHMNPYASILGDRNPLEVMGATSERLCEVFDTLGPEGAALSVAPGKWSAREILCHLADTELAFGFRLRQALAEAHHILQPFDQDAWARGYASCDTKQALAVFSAIRQWNIAFIRTATPDEFSTRVSHPQRGEMTFNTLVEIMAGHDLNHLRQLETILSQRPSA